MLRQQEYKTKIHPTIFIALHCLYASLFTKKMVTVTTYVHSV